MMQNLPYLEHGPGTKGGHSPQHGDSGRLIIAHSLAMTFTLLGDRLEETRLNLASES